ncbi:hypothetical protein QTI66_24200 [Variovorax sp. J22R133]|uniref:type IV pilus modification PilV family protein n=1 Tax=Variovorax brevis TaxID=3053503 RepID=UPI0025769065|nr:hypothetical protein [Variovorax sp. J22R133]MDM0115274.1 hypothetical protein [Variovorax sp. J22R133]
MTSRPRPHSTRLQRGVMLIEALVGMAIFSFAILGIMGLQATAIRTVRDADYRSKASLFANQIVARMWVDRFNVPTYALNADEAACAPGSNTTTKTAVYDWIYAMSDMTNPGALPGAANLQQQIIVGPNNTVSLTLCWQAPQDTAPHNFTLKTQILG